MSLRKLYLKIFVLAVILAASYYFSVYWLTSHMRNSYYHKFTSASHSLILGMSRANYGIAPEVLSAELSSIDYEGGFLNFAIEKSQSPYGKVYYEAIRKKLLPNTTHGIFILDVSPGSFTASKRLTSEEEIIQFDRKSILGKMESLNAEPNFEFVRKAYGGSLYKGFFPNKEDKPTTVFHKDGWEEFKLSFKGTQIKESAMKQWRSQTINGIESILAMDPETVSEHRLKYFEKLISFLQEHGRVYLVRIPMDRQLIELENNFWPEFDKDMAALAKKKGVLYLNYALPEYFYETFEGSHLHALSARKFSKDLATAIKQTY